LWGVTTGGKQGFEGRNEQKMVIEIWGGEKKWGEGGAGPFLEKKKRKKRPRGKGGGSCETISEGKFLALWGDQELCKRFKRGVSKDEEKRGWVKKEIGGQVRP